jgi:phosphatidylglycerophosphate synthase
VRSVGDVPPFVDFVTRRFAAPGPFWSWMIFEPIGGALAYGFARLSVPPAAVTGMGGACGVAGAIVLGGASTAGHVVVAAVLLLLAYAFDCADGQLARATGRVTPSGAWLDVAVDSVVVAFVSAALTFALISEDRGVISLVIGGAFGASRTASLFTSTIVRREGGGMALSRPLNRLRTLFVALIDTPVVYAGLCATRLTPGLLELVVLAVTILTAMQTGVSARHHFRSRVPPQ